MSSGAAHDHGLDIPPGMSLPAIDQAFRREGYGDEEPKTEGQRFVEACLEWISKWFEEFKDSDLKGQLPFAFLFDSARPVDQILPQGKQLPAFSNACELAICGNLYAAGLNLRRVFGQASTFKTIPEVLGHLVDQGLTAFTAVVVSPESKLALVHNGGGDVEEAYPIRFKPLRNGDFTFDRLDSVLETFYKDAVATHACDCDIWKSAKQRKLKEFAERQIQGTLHLFLKHVVLPASARVDKEIHTSVGREDIRILRAATDRKLEAAVLELKVLRDHHNPDALTWAKQGVDQAFGYSNTDSSTIIRYVCCYDARKTDEAMPDGVNYAKGKDVRWRRYYMTTPGSERLIEGFDS